MFEQPVYVSLEFTPNPNTLKYSVNRTVLDPATGNGTANMTDAREAQERSPLAAALFSISGVSGVMLGRDFVTLTKSEAGDWDVVHREASRIIQEHLGANRPVWTGGASSAHKGGQTPVEVQIREILDREIRPAVANDGGDITFERFENGTVFLYLQGACAGCPSSTITLKQGIETRLKALIPEVKEVVAV